MEGAHTGQETKVRETTNNRLPAMVTIKAIGMKPTDIRQHARYKCERDTDNP
jgi:hypothetical protein